MQAPNNDDDEIVFESSEYSSVKDLKVNYKSAEQIHAELFNKAATKETPDPFEIFRPGKTKKEEAPKIKTVRKHAFLQPSGTNGDSAIYDELMNDPKYSVELYKDNWSKEGVYQIFIVYTEKIEEDKTNITSTA